MKMSMGQKESFDYLEEMKGYKMEVIGASLLIGGFDYI